MSTITLNSLQARKAAAEPFAVLTCYDASFARLLSTAGIEALLVGDTLGMLLQGHDSTLPVTVEDMAYHVACTARGNQGAFIIGDLPFASYSTVEQALASSAVLMRAGAHCVKLEGGAWLLDSIRALSQQGIPVCSHLGLTPQSVNAFGGFKVQGRQPEQARRILEDALAVQEAGASLLVLECVPRSLAAEITRALRIPVIGIGAGPDTDGQVLVLQDMLGITPKPPRFVRNFMEDGGSIETAVRRYREAVIARRFPEDAHCYR